MPLVHRSDQKTGGTGRVEDRFPVHQRIRFGGTSRQDLRSHFRCHRGHLHSGRAPVPGRCRNPVHHQLRRPGGRGARSRDDHPREPGRSCPVRHQGHRLRTEGIPLAKGGRPDLRARPVEGHRDRCGRGRQQGRRCRRSRHNVRVRLPRDRGVDAGAHPLRPRHPSVAICCPPFRRRTRTGSRRQEPGHSPIRERQAGARRFGGGLRPARPRTRPRSGARHRQASRGRRTSAGMDVRRGAFLRQSHRTVRHRRVPTETPG